MNWSKLINFILLAVIAYLVVQKFIVNKPNKNIDINTLEIVDLDNNSIDLSELEGKGIFLNFWASWCAPCMAEMPSIVGAAEHFKNNDDLIFLIVNTESIADAKSIQSKEKYKNLPIYSLRNSGNIEIKAIPLTYLINANGKVEKVHAGVNYWNNPVSRKRIRNLAP